jgi:hypothetical protein
VSFLRSRVEIDPADSSIQAIEAAIPSFVAAQVHRCCKPVLTSIAADPADRSSRFVHRIERRAGIICLGSSCVGE